MYNLNMKLEELIAKWEETEDYKLIKKIKRLTKNRPIYKLCKAKYRETENVFFIKSICEISLFYRIKAFLFAKKQKKKSVNIQNKVCELNNLITRIAKNEKYVYIMQYSFFDQQGINCFSGGGERYACDLGKIIKQKGYIPILFQLGCEQDLEPWIREFEDLTVIGINANSAEYLQIINKLQSPKLTIYSGCISWQKNAHKPSILISHGITWDAPLRNADISQLKNNLNIADCLVSVDTNTISWFRSTYSKYISDNNIKMRYLPNYVDLKEYHPTLSHKNQRLKVLYPRRCSPERGFWLVYDIIPELLTKFQNIEFELVGFAHTEEIECKIKELVKKFPNRIKHYVCDANEMPNVYKNADISIIPTLYSEGTSLSCIEAMASGNAVISTNVGGLPNLIINNYNGVLIDPDQASLLNALETLICDENLRNNLKKNALDVAKAFSKRQWDYGWNLILDEYLNEENTNSSQKTILKDCLQDKYLKNILSNVDKNKKNRLFISTGFISSINAMSIISDLDNENFENHLIIYTSKTSNSFKSYNRKLILENHFKQVYFADDLSIDENIRYIQDENFLAQFDEIYTTAQPSYQIYDKHKNISLIEEGISSYFPMSSTNYDNISKIYLSNYFNKITYLDKSNINKVDVLDKNKIKTVIEQIKQKNDIDFKYFKKNNQLLMLSQYIYQDFYSDGQVVEFYAKHINYLISLGYSILFKSHPRVNDTITNKLADKYKNNSMFNFFPVNAKYPIELIMNDLDIKAIVTSTSGGAINCSHLFDIPCYGFGAKLVEEKHPFKNVAMYADIFLKHLPHISQINRKEDHS